MNQKTCLDQRPGKAIHLEWQLPDGGQEELKTNCDDGLKRIAMVMEQVSLLSHLILKSLCKLH